MHQPTTSNRGFTIVELLIVVVIIAILAAITIVAYNGIQNRAKTSSAQSAAANAVKKAEAYNADDTSPTNGYPQSMTQLTSAAATTVYKLDGVTAGVPANTAGTATNTLRYTACGHNGTATAPAAAANITMGTGGKVEYFDYQNSNIKTITFGNTTEGGNPSIKCFVSN